jgi:hypothetical protein
MANLIQICASANDLFGLDADGVVYHYNFNTNNWMRLDRGRRDDGKAVEHQTPIAHAEAATDHGRREAEPSARGDRHEPAG